MRERRRWTVHDLRRDNRSVLLSSLFFEQPRSRQQLSEATGLSPASVSNVVRDLIDDALIRRNVHALFEIAILTVVVTVVGFVLNILSSYRYVRISAECLFTMRLSVYRHLQRLAPRYYNKTKLGDLVSRINNDISEVQRICSDTLLSVFSNVLFFVGSVAMMIWLNWHLFLLSVVLLPVGIIALRHYQGRLTVQTRTLRERSADLGSFLIESLLGMRLIVASGNEGHEAERFRRLNASFVQSMLSMQITSFLASALPSTVLALSTALVFFYGGKLVIDGHLTVGGLVAFMAYHMRLLSPVQSLLAIYTNLLTGGVALSRVFEVLDAPVDLMAPRGAPEAPPPQSLEDAERRHIETVLNSTHWVVEGPKGAAGILKMNPSTLRSLMKRLAIRRPA